MKKTFSKSDFKTGMRIERPDGTTRMVYVATDKIYFCGSDGAYMDSSDYDEYLRCDGYDIARVYDLPKYKFDFFNPYVKGDLIWQREEQSTNDYAIEIDGVQYSESTLRSLIKKATQS